MIPVRPAGRRARFFIVLTVTLVAAHAVAASALAAQSTARAGRALTVEDYYRLNTVGSPRISPNARWVAYTVGERIEADNSTRTSTWVVRADGSAAPRRIAHDGADVEAPAWIDDGRLTYRVGDGTFAIDVAASGAVPTSVVPPEEGVASRDGRWRATTRRMPAPARRPAYASDFERRHEERFRGIQFDWLNHKRDGRPDPVPDPRDPTANPSSEIFLTSAGGDERQLTRLALQPSDVRWTIDGAGILFTADPDYRDERVYGGDELYFVTLQGETHRLTDDGHVYGNPAFSPDGRSLAFTRSLGTDLVIRDRLDHGGARDVWVMPWPVLPDDDAMTHAVNLTADWDLDPAAPVWSPDGRHLYFTAGIGGESHLFRVPAGGGAVEQVTSGPRRLSGIDIDRAFRTMAYTVGTYDRPSDIYIANIDGTGERRLTDIHAAFLEGIETSRAERVRYASADGTPIEGWIILPHGYRPDGGPYPLIVSNHGGPHSAVGYGFDFKDQLFAASGYFVLEVNFRGSTGYGDAFKWATWGAWGTKDGQDVIAGVDHVVANYPIDPARVGTTGHSYGGFMTNWLITQYPDRFAAAVSGAGISNWISDYGMADIARTKETEFFGTPWQDEARDLMIRQSPLFYADRVRAPTLFIHGEVDYRVPYAEAEQFHFALRKNGVPARIIRYEGQAHGIGGHWNNVHRMMHELAWWEEYLKPPRT